VAFRFNNWLTIKVTRKKYGAGRGELMLIHLCIECGRPSINRIAADDDSQRVFNVFVDSFRLEIPPQSRLEANGSELCRPRTVRQSVPSYLGISQTWLECFFKVK
jgi:hypothetical protein